MKKIRQLKAYPVIPRDAEDPAHQKPNLRRAMRDLKARFERINKGVKELVKEQERHQSVASNNRMAFWFPLDDKGERTQLAIANRTFYVYEVDTTRYDTINAFIERLLYSELLESVNGRKPPMWFFQSYLQTAFNDGLRDALQSAKNQADPEIVGQEISAALRQMDDEIVSPQALQSLGLVYSRVFNEMKGLTDSMKVDLSETLTRGMASGLGIRQITRDIVKRVGVGFGRAQRIARTEILQAYRTAQRAKTDELNETVYDDSPWVMRNLWFSALASTTRPWHASRNGEVYTTQEVQDFYAENGNSINCLCSQSPILINEQTGEVVQKELIKKMKAQAKIWRTGMRKAA